VLINGPHTECVGQCSTGQARPVPLLGREAELERLVAASRAARDGHGTIVLISGEPGIGKTALLTALVTQTADDGARVAAGAAEELGQRVPFAAVAGCLGLTTGSAGAADRGAAEIAGMLRGSFRPSGGSFPAVDAEFLITEAILGLVDRWCAAGAVVLAVDDLQWADPASLMVLRRLGRIASQLPLLITATRRSGAGGADVDRLVRSWEARNAELLPLGPLDDLSVATLASQAADGQAADALPADGLLADGLAGKLAAAAGNPLYVTGGRRRWQAMARTLRAPPYPNRWSRWCRGGCPGCPGMRARSSRLRRSWARSSRSLNWPPSWPGPRRSSRA